IQRLLLARCTKIIVTSDNYLGGSSQLSRFRNKTTVIPIGIKTKFSFNGVKYNAIVSQYQSKFIIYSLGRFVYYKGFEFLINSAKFLDDNFVILIGGTGPLFSPLQRMIDKIGVRNKVTLIGKVHSEDLSAYYKACSVFCLPSIQRSEAFGVVLLEAM